MGRIQLSERAARAVKAAANEASADLLTNVNVMDNNVNSLFSGLKDPSVRKYLELSNQMQDMIKQMAGSMEAISEYCDKVIAWMQSYSES